MPALEGYNPAVRESLLRLSGSAAIDLAHLESEADEAWRRVSVEDNGRVRLRRDSFSQVPEAIGRRVLRRAVHCVKGDLKDVEMNHIEHMARLMADRAGARLDLPGGVSFEVGYEVATVARTEREPRAAEIEGFELRVPGRTESDAWTVDARCVERSEARLSACPDGLTVSLDLEAAGSPLSVRGRAPGDRFQPLGMAGSKSLKDFLSDSRVPRQDRDSTPLVVSPRGIVWVVGCRIAHWARVTADTRRVLEIEFRPAPGGRAVT